LVTCSRCGEPYPLPVEPLYSRETVCALVPIKLHSLASWITRNPGKLSLHYTGARPKRRRLFTADDVRVLRASLVHDHT
jgi:hypothetical protein